jgi:inner membrane protein
MPTVLGHAAVPLALGLGLGRPLISRRLLLAGVVASVLPDADVVGFWLGTAYPDAFGHRGATHSLVFALLLGVIAAARARPLAAGRGAAFAFVAVCAASHGLLDMLTNGGYGIALWWPFSPERFFAPWQPIEVSPIGLRRLASERGLEVLGSELIWVWLPAALVWAGLWLARRGHAWPRTSPLIGLLVAVSSLAAVAPARGETPARTEILQVDSVTLTGLPIARPEERRA